MRSHLVVVLTPNSDDLAGPSQGFEPILVEAFVPDLAVEALDAGVGGTHFPSTYPFNPSVLSIYNLGNDESGLAVYGFGSPTVEGVSWSANFVAAPVPEPSFYTMMLGGLMLGGLMLCGVVARRRSS